MTNNEFKKISTIRNMFCILSEGAQTKLSNADYMALTYEEVFINMVNHVVLQFGEPGREWLKRMFREWVGCAYCDAKDKVMIK